MKSLTRLVLSIVLFLQVTLAFGGQLMTDLELYQQKTKELLQEESNPVVQSYLRACLAAAASLEGMDTKSPGLYDAATAAARGRQQADAMLTPATSGTPAVLEETKIYNEHLNTYRDEQWIPLLAAQDDLLERKYFKTQTAKNANFLEGYFNGRFSLTRTDRSDPATVLAKPHMGVSPWEFIFRIEPAAAMRNGPQAAFLGVGGLTRAYFPNRKVISPPEFKETFRSKWIKKTGVRVGAGVASLDGDTRFVFGPGVQVHALAIWGLYEPRDGRMVLALGTSDLGKLKKVIGWFD